MTVTSRRAPLSRVLLGGLVVGLLVLAGLAARSAAVVDKGLLLDYTQGTIYQLEVFGVRFYLEPETSPSLDWFNAAALFAVAGTAALTWLVMRGRTAGRDARFYLLVALGTAWLGFDELIGLHESIGHNAQWLGDLPGVGHPDDAIVAAYGVAALAFVVLYRRTLLQRRATLLWWVGALVCFGLAVVGDTLSLPVEEPLELAATGAVVIGFLGLAADRLRPADPVADAERFDAVATAGRDRQPV